MKPHLLFVLLVTLVGSIASSRAELPTDITTATYRLTPGQNDADWQPLLSDLRSKPPLKAVFEERRFFPFRKNPVTLTGEIRLDAERGLSLHYLTPDDRIMVVDSRGGFMIDEKSRRRELPDDPRAQAATRALLNVMRFDLTALDRNFELFGVRDGSVWRFAFVPRPGVLAEVLFPIIVTGEGALLREIEMRKTGSQRVQIIIGETATGVTFSADELARFFR